MRTRAIGENTALDERVTFVDARALIDTRPLVGATELQQTVGFSAQRRVVDHDRITVDFDNGAVVVGQQHVTSVASRAGFDAGTDVRSRWLDQRNRLALHVRAHQRAVRIVVLKERNQCRCHRNNLLRRNVHVLDFVGRNVANFTTTRSHQHARFSKIAAVVDNRVGLRNDVTIFVVGREILDVVGDPAVRNLAVRRLDEPERVDTRKARQIPDQTNVRTFRRFDRTHPAVVAWVDISDFEAGAFTAQTTRSKRGQTTTVRQRRQWIRLVHELAELR